MRWNYYNSHIIVNVACEISGRVFIMCLWVYLFRNLTFS
jgi:hypothetical protein